MKAIICVAFLALCVLAKEEDKAKDEKSNSSKRGIDYSHTIITDDFLPTGGWQGSDIHYDKHIFTDLNYAQNYKYDFDNINFGHHFIHKPEAIQHHIPEIITKHVVVAKPVPVPHAVPVKVDHPVPVPVNIPEPYPVPVPKPYPVTITRPVGVAVERIVKYPVVKPVPYPVEKIVQYPVEKREYFPVHIPVERRVPVHIPKPYPVYQVKNVPYPVHKTVHVPVKVKVDVPVPHPVPVHVDKPYPVHVPHPVPVPVDRPYPVPVHRPVPVPFVRKVPYPVPHSVPVHVEKHIPVPIHHKIHVDTPVVYDHDPILYKHGIKGWDSPAFQFEDHIKTGFEGAIFDGKPFLHDTTHFSTGGIQPADRPFIPSDFNPSFEGGFDDSVAISAPADIDIRKSIEVPLKFSRSATTETKEDSKSSETSASPVNEETKEKSS